MYVLDMLLASIFNMSINNQEGKKCKCCAIKTNNNNFIRNILPPLHYTVISKAKD
mgnify:CR=1 FL=1